LRPGADLKVLFRVARRAGKAGAPRSFGLGHVFMALYFIDDNVRMSREGLGASLGLGGGAVRSLVSKLRGSSLISTFKGGSVLSEKGIRVIKGLRTTVPTISGISVLSLSTGRNNVAAIVRGIDGRGLDPISIRDDVIRAGGTGATTAFYDGDSIRVPGVYDDLSAISKADVNALMRLNLKRGDVVVIAGGTSQPAASVACAAVIVNFLSGCSS